LKRSDEAVFGDRSRVADRPAPQGDGVISEIGGHSIGVGVVQPIGGPEIGRAVHAVGVLREVGVAFDLVGHLGEGQFGDVGVGPGVVGDLDLA